MHYMLETSTYCTGDGISFVFVFRYSFHWIVTSLYESYLLLSLFFQFVSPQTLCVLFWNVGELEASKDGLLCWFRSFTPSRLDETSSQ